MAAACCIGYATIRWYSPIDWSLISIAVGYLVGRAVRTGANGLGGRRLQSIAVGFTYLAIVFSYVPLMLREAEGWSALLIPVLATLSLALPVLELFESPGSGIIGLLIVGFGLLQAWRLTARDRRTLSGPFERQAEAAASA